MTSVPTMTVPVRTWDHRADSKEPYGPASKAHYADPGYQKDGQKRYPLDSEDHCRAAWSYINQAANAAKYTPDELARIKGRIKAAGKKYGIEFSDQRSRSLRFFDESKYERDPKNQPTGGQFKTKAAEKAPAKKTTKKAPAKKATTRRPAAKKAESSKGDMAYDPDTGRGPGYGTAGGDARVKQLQTALNRLGLTDSRGQKLKVDGKLGPKTTQAIKAAQRRLGMKADGRVTPAMLAQFSGAKSLSKRAKPKNCTCGSVECIADECGDDTEYRRTVPDVCVRAFDFESRSRGGDGRTLEGYVAVFGAVARIASSQGGDFDEEIHRGAFDDSLGRSFPVMQFDHGRDTRVGSVPIGVYEVFEPDSRGYFVRGKLLDNPVVEPVRQAITAGAIRGMSWRMMVDPAKGSRWTRRSGQVDKRDVIRADVPEAGPVVFPAYDATTVSVRSILAAMPEEERAALVRELAAEVRLAVDLNDFTGRSSAWSTDGGELGPERQEPEEPTSTDITARFHDPDPAQAGRERLLRLQGVLK